MEYIREHRFSVYVDTNKRTIKKSFDSLSQLVAYVRDLARTDDEFSCLTDDEGTS